MGKSKERKSTVRAQFHGRREYKRLVDLQVSLCWRQRYR